MTWRGAAGRGAGISARETERMDLTGGPALAATEAGTRLRGERAPTCGGHMAAGLTHARESGESTADAREEYG